MSRMWGSCLDHVIEVEVVTADGSIQRASSTKNSDLFWVGQTMHRLILVHNNLMFNRL